MNQIETCKTCTNRQFSKDQGIICKLTSAKPSFENSCSEYILDETQVTNKSKIIKPNEKRANYAILLIWIILGLEVVSLISSYFQFDLLQTAANGGEISTEAATLNDSRESIIAIIYSIFSIVSAITFIQWFRRAYFNLHQHVNHLSYTEGWAAGSWFVPIINLFRPYQIMKELYAETKLYLTNKGEALKENFTTNALGLWWTFWIIGNIIGQFSFRYSLRAETIDELTVSTIAYIIGHIVGIPLALITIKVIKDYSRVEVLLKEVD